MEFITAAGPVAFHGPAGDSNIREDEECLDVLCSMQDFKNNFQLHDEHQEFWLWENNFSSRGSHPIRHTPDAFIIKPITPAKGLFAPQALEDCLLKSTSIS